MAHNPKDLCGDPADTHVIPNGDNAERQPRLCGPCTLGDHGACWAAYCWGCIGPHRKHGRGGASAAEVPA